MCPTEESTTASNLLEALRPLQHTNNGSRTQYSIIQTQSQVPTQSEPQCLPQVKCEPSSRIVFQPSSLSVHQQNEIESEEDSTEIDRTLDPEPLIEREESESGFIGTTEDSYLSTERNDRVDPLMNEEENASCDTASNPALELQVHIDRQSGSLDELQTPLEKELFTPPKKRRCPEWNELGSPGAHSTSSVEGVLRVRSDLSVASPHPYVADVDEHTQDE